jgi:pimeloyl-[acyl-carrier protein] methyl ester esterase
MVYLVLLPGMDGTGELFADFVANLDPGISTIVVRYPVDQPLDYVGLQVCARAFLPANASYILLGESFSGPVAIAIAASRPVGLIGLVLACTFSVNPHPHFKALQPLVRFLPFSARAVHLFSPILFGRSNSPALRRALRSALLGLTRQVFHKRLNAVLDVDYSLEMESIDIPILYLQASADRIVFASAARHIARVSRRVSVVKIDGPHLLLQARASEAAAVVSSFVISVGANR